MKIEYVYQSTAQLRNTETLTPVNPAAARDPGAERLPGGYQRLCPMETFKQVDKRRGRNRKTDRRGWSVRVFCLLVRSLRRALRLYVFALDGFAHPEKGRLYPFSRRPESFIAAFFLDFSANFSYRIWLIQKSLAISKRYSP